MVEVSTLLAKSFVPFVFQSWQPQQAGPPLRGMRRSSSAGAWSSWLASLISCRRLQDESTSLFPCLSVFSQVLLK